MRELVSLLGEASHQEIARITVVSFMLYYSDRDILRSGRPGGVFPPPRFVMKLSRVRSQT